MRWGWCRVKSMRMEPANTAAGVEPEEKGFLVLGKAAPFIGVASCSAARSVAMKRRPISTRASMCITPSGRNGIGNLARSPLRRSLRGEERRPIRLEVGWEKDGEGKPADPSQARLQTSRHEK